MVHTDYHILLVEDAASSVKLTRLVLEQAGFTVDSVATGAEALRAADSRDYDLILLALKLPDINGLEVVRRLHASPGTRQVPIVAVTAHAMPGDGEHAIAAGCDGYITKPIDVGRFADQIRDYLAPAGEGAEVSTTE